MRTEFPFFEGSRKRSGTLASEKIFLVLSKLQFVFFVFEFGPYPQDWYQIYASSLKTKK